MDIKIDGVKLDDVKSRIKSCPEKYTHDEVLVPRSFGIQQDIIYVKGEYIKASSYTDHHYFVAEGNGKIKIDGLEATLKEGDTFVVQREMTLIFDSKENTLVLYRFGL